MWRPVLCICFISLAFSAKADSQIEEYVSVDVVDVYVSVLSNKGEPIKDMIQEDFTLEVDGKKQEITYFSRILDTESNVPVHVAVLVDTSGSMSWAQGKESKKTKLDAARSYARAILKELKAGDKVQLFRFDTTLQALTRLTSDTSEIDSALRSVEINEGAHPATRLNAVLETVAGVMRKYSGRRVLVLLSDGWNNLPGPKPDDIIELFREIDITLIAFGIQSPEYIQDDKLNSDAAQNLLAQAQLSFWMINNLVESTGGYLFHTNPGGQLDVVRRVLSVLRSQYILSFKPVSSQGRSEHTIRVNCSRKGCKLRYRKRYSD